MQRGLLPPVHKLGTGSSFITTSLLKCSSHTTVPLFWWNVCEFLITLYCCMCSLLFLGDYTNSSFTYERSDSHREIPGDYRQSVPVYQLTQPSLDTNSFEQSSPFSNYSLSVTQEDFSSNLPVSA